MNLKYIFVSGGVISGIGKGTTAASVALLLKLSGYKVAIIKFENYLNLDAGTINPIEHGDPFLCDDGTEADMDIGTYEKFLNENMTKENFVTMGQIYKTVIERERRFEYMGEDVEAIPYITDEIIRRINLLAKKKRAEIILVELGGTAGEYQNVLYYEASRILALKNPGDVLHIHVSYVPTPKHLGEPKTKPTQLSVKTLNSMGIQPDIIIARSEEFLDKRRRDRFALFCNLQSEMIISNPNLFSVYQVPLILSQQDLEIKILKKLGLKPIKSDLKDWEKLVETIRRLKKKKVTISIVGKYFGTGDYQLRDAYAALFDALDHAAWNLQLNLKINWVDAEEVEKKGIEIIGQTQGIIVPIGWGERGAEGMIASASYARIKKIPYLGLCYGMQLAVVSFARDVLGWKKANTLENDKKTPYPVITLMPAQEKYIKERAYGGTMRLGAWEAEVKQGTLTYSIYQKKRVWERHRHRYEFNNTYTKDFEKAGLIISGRSVKEGLVEFIELSQKEHPFYFGTQGHPEYKSRPLNPHPVFIHFLKAVMNNDN
ncbi:MAG: CTP synthase [Patescibacteria group bacterium]|nr:CTP synthase [Patescibacteria group bacterium]